MRSLCVVVFALTATACANIEQQLNQRDVEHVLQAIPSAEFRVLWAKQFASDSIDRFAKLTPSVAQNQLVFADRFGLVQSLDLETQHRMWEQKVDASFTAGPVISDKYVIIGSRDARLFLLDRKTGGIIWQKALSSEILAPPQLSQGSVIVQTNDGKIVALREVDGELIWSFERSVPILTLRGTSSPLIVGEKVLSGFANGKIAALSLFDGKLLWETAIAVPKGRSELERIVDVDGELLYADGVVYAVSYHGKLAAVSVDSGRVIWVREVSSFIGMNSDGNATYVVDDAGRVWAFDRNNGSTLWMQDKLDGRITSRPIVVGDSIVLGDKSGHVYWLSKSDGRITSRIHYHAIVDRGGIENPASAAYLLNALELMRGRQEVSVASVVSVPSNGTFIVKYRNGVYALLKVS